MTQGELDSVHHARVADRRGSALLAVMWFSAALSAIAFTLSMTVRTELDRAALNVNSTRAYFLAQGAVEIAAKRMFDRLDREEEFHSRVFRKGQRFMEIRLPGGSAKVDIIGDSGKLNVHSLPPEVLARLLMASGAESGRAVEIAGNIAWLRRGNRQRGNMPADILPSPPSFSLSPSSFQQLEDLLLAPGMTADLLYGGFVDDRGGNLVHVEGLYHQITMRGSRTIDANYASPALLRAAGLPPSEIDLICRMREMRPLTKEDFPNLRTPRQGFQIVFGRGDNDFTLWSTARLANGQAKRTVGAKITRARRGPLGFRTVRWFDAPF